MEPKTSHGGRRFAAGDVILERYVVESELGQGGMGIVYKCLDKVGGVKVAVKGLPPDVAHNEGEMEEIRANFQLVCDLRHENIAGVRTLEKDASGDYYLVMDLAHGDDLGSWMRKNKDADLRVRLSIIRQIASALDYAHRRRVMHRDIKPGNIMVSPSGRVLLLDFGLAAQISTSLSRSSRMVVSQSGTPAYKSPEQWRGKPQGAAADQYALAVVAYRLLSGRLPFDGDNVLILCRAVLEERPPAIKYLPSHINRALAKALAKDPHDRFQSCTEFVDALEGKSQSGGFWRLLFVILLTVGSLLAAGGAWLHFEKKRLLEERAAVEEAARKRVAEEEAKRRKAAEEEAKRQKAAEEEAKRQKAAEEEAKRQKAAEEEARRQRAAEEEAKRQRAAEEESRRKAEEEAKRQRAAEEEAKRQRAAEEEAKRQRAAEEEAKRQRAAEEEAKRQRAAEEELKRQKAAEEEAKRQAAEQATAGRRQEEPKPDVSNQPPSLTITATLDGQAVFGARMKTMNGEVILPYKWDEQRNSRLVNGKTLEYDITYSQNGVAYSGKLRVTVDWNGPRTVFVPLHKGMDGVRPQPKGIRSWAF